MIENAFIIEAVWKDIVGYEELYAINDFGIIKSKMKWKGRNYRMLIQEQTISKRSDGNYQMVSLNRDGNKKTFRVHKLVAEHFVPNPNNLPEVNHIDGNKLNCRASNLEWSTRLENEQHAWKLGLKNRFTNNKSKPLIQFDNTMNMVAEFANSQIAQEETGFNRSVIGRAARGDIRQAYGFIWKFKDV